jgi:hypothetical protein
LRRQPSRRITHYPTHLPSSTIKHDFLARPPKEKRPGRPRRARRRPVSPVPPEVAPRTRPCARTADAPSSDGLLKDDLVGALDTYLKAHSSRLAGDKFFAEYYDRSGSPVKKAARTADDTKDDKAKDKEPKRRKTVVKAEPSSP